MSLAALSVSSSSSAALLTCSLLRRYSLTSTTVVAPSNRFLARTAWNIQAQNRFLSSEASPPPPPSKSWGQHLWDRFSITAAQRRIRIAERLFRAAQHQTRKSIWYTQGCVPTEFRPRHSMLTLHVWFLHRRLLADRVDPSNALWIQEELFDILWDDTKSRIRNQDGISELTVDKHLRDVQQVTFQQCTHFDHAYTMREDGIRRLKEISNALWIHTYREDDDLDEEVLQKMSFYVDAQFQNICYCLPQEYFEDGRIGWVGPPTFSTRVQKLTMNKKLPSDLELPEPWLECLTLSGDPYYWDTDTNKTQWERPFPEMTTEEKQPKKSSEDGEGTRAKDVATA